MVFASQGGEWEGALRSRGESGGADEEGGSGQVSWSLDSFPTYGFRDWWPDTAVDQGQSSIRAKQHPGFEPRSCSALIEDWPCFLPVLHKEEDRNAP